MDPKQPQDGPHSTGWLAPLRRFAAALAAPPALWVPTAVVLALFLALAWERALDDAERVRALEAELAATQRSLAVLKQDLVRVTRDGSRQTQELAQLRRRLGMREAALAAAREDRAASEAPSQAAMNEPLVYATPAGPETVAAPSRWSGLTRSAAPGVPEVVALAPDHVGLTVSASPALYWRLSTRTDLPLAVTVLDPKAQKMLLDETLPGPQRRGYGRISLREHGVSLQPGRTYQWFVSVLAGDARAPTDPVAMGLIQRVRAAPELEAELRQGGAEARVYAQHGIWYDAVDAVSKQIARAPNDPVPRAHREALLKQVGLPEAPDD